MRIFGVFGKGCSVAIEGFAPVGSVATSHAEDTKAVAAEGDDMALFGDRSLFE